MKIVKKLACSLVAAAMCVPLMAVGGGWATVPASAETDYYASVTATEGLALLGKLHDLITTTHTHYTSYEDCKDPALVKRTDPGPDGELMEFYAQAKLSSKWESGARGTWNREHVWCQSLSGGLWGQGGGGSDLLHIRPTESRVNSARNNDKYGEVSNGSTVWYRDKSDTQIAVAGYEAGTVFEPIDTVKGDVARIVMYVFTHYNTYSNVGGTTNGPASAGYFGTLHFSNVISASTEDAAVELLLKWHNADPVDDLELARNEAAMDIQGNRNPFVDHPEYADMVWSKGPVGPQDPSGGEVVGPVDPEADTVTITLSSFDLTENYGFKKWSEGGIGGIAYIYGGSGSYPANQGMQFNKNRDSYYIASNLPAPRPIRSVTVKSYSGTADKPWKLLTSDMPYGEVAKKPTNGTDHGTKTVTEGGVTWVLDGEDTYFALTYELEGSKGAGYLDAIIIEYAAEEPDESEDPGQTETPGGSETPGGTETPGGNENPGQTETPGGNENPGETETPGGNENPGETQTPSGGDTPLQGGTSSRGCGGMIGGGAGMIAAAAAAVAVAAVRRRKR